jgi:hypothetical protein
MSDNEIIITLIIICIIINKMGEKEILLKLLFALFSWNPTVRFYLSRQFRIFSSVGFISYGTFPATVLMSLYAVLLKLISFSYNYLNRTKSRSGLYKIYILLISLLSVLILSANRNVDLQCGMLFSSFLTQDFMCFACSVCVLSAPAMQSSVRWY